MGNQNNSNVLSVIMPGPGQTQVYKLVADKPVQFGFDLSDAVFVGQGGDLAITVEGGGTVILEGYLEMAEQGTLPTFQLMDGEQMPGDFYMFAFAEDGLQSEEAIETAAGEQTGGSGAGEYGDDPGTLGDGIDALGGQGDAYAPTMVESVEEITNEEIVEAEGETPVQLVLNPNFEGGEGGEGFFPEDGPWREGDLRTGQQYHVETDYADHWRNDGEMEFVGVDNILIPNGPGGVIPVGPGPFGHPNSHFDAPITVMGGEGDGQYMMVDSTPFSKDTLTQAVAVQAGEDTTISFSFSPMEAPYYWGPTETCPIDFSTNNFLLFLGEQEVADISWGGRNDAGQFVWFVELGEGVSLPPDSPIMTDDEGRLYFLNPGIVWDQDENFERMWTDLGFTLTVEEDHSEIRFVENVPEGMFVVGLDNLPPGGVDLPNWGANDGRGALIDNVSAFRNFENVIYDESDYFMDRVESGQMNGFDDFFDYLGDNIQPIAGTEGEDAIFGDTPEPDGSRPILDGEETGLGTVDLDIIDGQGGDDAIYGGNGVNVLLGGDGNDFVVGGRGLNIMAGEQGDDYLRGGRGLNILVGGQGDDIIESGQGRLGVFQPDGDLGDLVGDGDLGMVLSMFNSANIIVTGDGNDMVKLGDGADLIFVNRSMLGSGNNSIYVENYNALFDPEDFDPGDMDEYDTMELLHSDFFVLGEGVSVDWSTENAPRIEDGNLLFHIISDDTSGDDAWVTIADVGNWYSSPPSTIDLSDYNILDGDLSPTADLVNDAIQWIINGATDLA